MKRISLTIGLTCLLALGACSGTGDEATNSSEEVSQSSMNSEETGSMSKNEEAESSEEEQMEESSLKIMITEEKTEEHESHGAHVSISLENDEMNPVVLMTKIAEEEELLTEANVRFEYWKEGEEKHTYTDTEENGEGMYEGTTEISEPGTYKLKVHVEKGEELHTHKPYVLEVTES
ncbi:FixH family protein [Guptibacillus hwajinpoensis]|uniref:FixH family protein n=1 Tax=Guptibacillus hwajinpoensis TaxID=208199 RepID=UPI001CFCAD5B|nr:FixH family protein [Pseudalkalibacillus hwajinpoensis]WLR58915.1 FixH family protein [Pseudalkalibacillus hwajinpoensis]